MKHLLELLVICLLAATPSFAGEPEPEPIPNSIIGTWQLDLVRTMSEFMDEQAQQHPTSKTQIVEVKSGIEKQAAAGALPTVTATFTETTFTTTSRNTGPLVHSYKIIGGNAGLAVIQYTAQDGGESLMNIRILNDALAIETTNCEKQPTQCDRERRQMVERLKRHPSTNTLTGTEQSRVDGMVGTDERALARSSQPKVFYFTPMKDD